MQEWVDQAASVARQLGSSPSLRTVLQTILAARNILSQKGCPGYTASSLEHLSSERLPRHAPSSVDPLTGEVVPVSLTWIQEHNPSVLTLVSEMLIKTHEHRCRLRFLRMFAIGRLVSIDTLRRQIWSYLDDLHESPWDALALLGNCKRGLCDRDRLDDMSGQAMKFRQILRQDFVHLQEHTSFQNQAVNPHSAFSTQILQLQARFANALQICDDAVEAMTDTAVHICRLGGNHAVLGTRSFEAAGDILQSMRYLGLTLREEMLKCQAKRCARAVAVLRSSRCHDKPTVRWAPVDTRIHQLMVTVDTDLIRQFRAEGGSKSDGPHGSGVQEMDAQGAGGEQENEKMKTKKEEEVHAAFYDAIHSGPEGVYRRDPLTGKWGLRADGVDGTHSAVINLGGPRPDL